MRRDFLIGSFLVLFVAAVFFPVLQADFVQWDDDINIYANPNIQSLSAENLRWMFTDCTYTPRYRPLNWLGWALLWKFSGGTAGLFHAVALALHAANTVLFFFLLRKILRWGLADSDDNNPQAQSICAALGALFWAVHPLRTEVAAWINCQTYTQSLFFLLISLLFYFRSAEKSLTSQSASIWQSRSLWLSTLFFAMAMLTYPTAAAFVIVLLVIDVYCLKRLSCAPKNWLKESREVLLEKIPYAAITVGVSLVAFSARAHLSGNWRAIENMAGFSWAARSAQAFYIWAYYLWRPFWPMNLSPAYTRLIEFEPTDWPFVVSGITIFGGTIFLFCKRRRWPLLFALWICHLALLVPMLGLTEHPHYANDRYSYIVGLLWSVLLAVALAKISRWRAPATLTCATLILVCAFLSSRQTHIWNNTVGLLQSVIARLDDAPSNKAARRWQADLYCRLANFLAAKGNNREALGHYRTALTINPKSADAHNNLAIALLRQNRLDEAIDHLTESLRIAPKDSLTHFNLATILDRQGNRGEALKEYFSAVECNPRNADAQNNLGIALFQTGKYGEGMEHIQCAVRLNPENPQARYSAGSGLMQLQKFPEALDQLSAAVKLKPDFAEAHYNLGNVLAMMNRLPEALPHFAKVVELNPKTAEVYMPLGMALSRLGRKEEAIATFRKATALAEAAGQKELVQQIRLQMN